MIKIGNHYLNPDTGVLIVIEPKEGRASVLPAGADRYFIRMTEPQLQAFTNWLDNHSQDVEQYATILQAATPLIPVSEIADALAGAVPVQMPESIEALTGEALPVRKKVRL
jgi:hypothetical protein